VKIKVCGITSYEDAAMALDLGVDALGFNLYAGSPRYLDPATAGGITRRLPPFAATVALFVDETDIPEVEQQAGVAGARILQLHGAESPDYCRRLSRWDLIKTLHIGPAGPPAGLEEYPVSAFLLDTQDSARHGGTGRTFDWAIVKHLQFPRPIILAGGLRPQNVGDAILAVRPYAVDVCSGVESAAGKKDRGKLLAFVREVRNAARDIDSSDSSPSR